MDERIKKVAELYQGKYFRYMLLELTGMDSLTAVLASLEEHPQILLLQPDVLQLRSFRRGNGQSSYLPKAREAGQSEAYRKNLAPKNRVKTRSGQKKPIRIAIIDDGFDLTHPEFARTKVVFQYDTETRTQDTSPKHLLDTHGTRIAGVLFAAVNGNLVEGLVPDAELVAIRQPNTWTSETLLAFQVAKLAGADVINCSWHSQWLLEPISDVVRDLALHGRGGKGVAVVFAAGNEGEELTAGLHEAVLNEAIVVGSCNSEGKRAKYSNWGESVDVFFDSKPRMSTARFGKYAKINGTSLAAANASGFIAKLLSGDSTLALADIEVQLRTN